MQCPFCGRLFKSNLALGVHAARNPACADPEASKERARERDRRRRAKGPRKIGAEYWRSYRARNPSVRERDTIRARARRQDPEHRRKRNQYEMLRRMRKRAEQPELGHLYEAVRHGRALSFWEDELRMDLEQVRALAELEGRDPDEAVREYRQREVRWHRITTSFLGDWVA